MHFRKILGLNGAWWIYGGRWQRWWYMTAVVVYGYGFGAVVVDGRSDDDGAAAA